MATTKVESLSSPVNEQAPEPEPQPLQADATRRQDFIDNFVDNQPGIQADRREYKQVVENANKLKAENINADPADMRKKWDELVDQPKKAAETYISGVIDDKQVDGEASVSSQEAALINRQVTLDAKGDAAREAAGEINPQTMLPNKPEEPVVSRTDFVNEQVNLDPAVIEGLKKYGELEGARNVLMSKGVQVKDSFDEARTRLVGEPSAKVAKKAEALVDSQSVDSDHANISATEMGLIKEQQGINRDLEAAREEAQKAFKQGATDVKEEDQGRFKSEPTAKDPNRTPGGIELKA